jgi:transcriptional regulator with XRE-family HTH domain
MVVNIKAIRKQRGMTQAQLAIASNIHRVTIAKYEAGKVKPSLDSAERMAGALGVPVDELIRKEERTA